MRGDSSVDDRGACPAESMITSAAAGLLLERLMAVVRPEFRVEVFRPAPDDPVFSHGVCGLPSCPAAVRHPRAGLCEVHRHWWVQDGKPAWSDWLAVAEQRLVAARGDITDCAVIGCNRAPRRHGLCVRHEGQWKSSGRAGLPGWLTTVSWSPPSVPERDCRFSHCPRWSEGGSNPFCAVHRRRWIHAGRPPVGEWIDELGHRFDPQLELHTLGQRLRLEVGYGLQRRRDLGARRTPITVLVTALTYIHRAGVVSLLDFDDQQWRAHTWRPNADGAGYQSFILDTCFELRALLIEDPWTDQYPREVWDLKVLGLDRGLRTLRFDRIPQPWLRELVKRWTRWRLSRGIAPLTVSNGLRACTRLAEHLYRCAPEAAGPEALTRVALESWFAALASAHPHPKTRATTIRDVGGFLRDVHRHGWAPELPHNAQVYDDTPRIPAAKPRWVSEHLMRQLEDPANVARFPSPEGGLLLLILMNCGLRLGDARRLPLECVVRDSDHAPYLAWINHKIDQRVAFFPISEDLAERIVAHQNRQRQRFPATSSSYLFTGYQANLDGRRALNGPTWSLQLERWLREIDLTDEHGRPARVTAHQFRHTVGTRLINNNVQQHVVQRLLDHMSPEMTAVYARMHQQTIRAQWASALKLNAEAEPAAIPAEHPLAEASWTRLSMVRAKVTLPNGYCGAPVQTECEYANPCLDCRFFITTVDFLDQHRRQRDEAEQAAAEAEQAGMRRVSEKNTRTAAKLTKLIDVLDTAATTDVVVGGRREPDDATG